MSLTILKVDDASWAIEVDSLRRTFRRGKGWRPKGEEVVALDGLSLTVPAGEVHGLLGPNGAGKTTLCKVLSTVLLPTSGTARIMGLDVVTDAARVRPLIGIVFGGERGLYGRLTALQNLRYWAALYKMPDDTAAERARSLLERFGLSERADSLVETFSRGMRQRLHLARGLIGDPRLLLLDEPTTGMDPVAAHEFRRLIDELRAEGHTILLTTHDMDEAEQVCDRVTFIDRGRVLATETPRAMAALAARHRWVEAEDVPQLVRGSTDALAGVVQTMHRDGLLRVKTDGPESASAVLDHLVRAGIRAVRLVPPTLEDVYLDLIGDRGMEV